MVFLQKLLKQNFKIYTRSTLADIIKEVLATLNFSKSSSCMPMYPITFLFCVLIISS